MLSVTAMRELCDRWAAELPASVKPVPLSVYRTHIERLLRELEITVEWRHPSQMPSGAAAFAEVRRRHVVIPPIVSETEFAIALHECGHVMAEDCRGGLHRRNRAVQNYWHCIRCAKKPATPVRTPDEVLAWTIAGILVRPLRWTTVMHQRLTHEKSLASSGPSARSISGSRLCARRLNRFRFF